MSALLISAIVMEKNFTINVTGTHGMAYVEMTRLMMKQFGLDVMQDKKNNSFIIPKKAAYESLDYDIEPDVSAACYFYAMSPLLHVKSKVMGCTKTACREMWHFLMCLRIWAAQFPTRQTA